jgi:hypothetical protein
VTFVLLGQCIMVSFTIKTFGIKQSLAPALAPAPDADADAAGIMDTISAVPGVIAEYSANNQFEVAGLSLTFAVSVVALTMSVMNFIQLNPGKAVPVSLPLA